VFSLKRATRCLYFCAVFLSMQADSVLLDLKTNSGEDYASLIKSVVVDPLQVSSIKYSSDSFFDQNEFDYLTELKNQSCITADMIMSAVEYLIKKNKFERIKLISRKSLEGVVLFFELESFWTFDRVTLRSELLGKDRLLHFYTMRSGDFFDMVKHQTSIQKIKKMLKEEGYFKANVQDKIFYHKKTKSVSVRIYLRKGPQFLINNAMLNVSKSINFEAEESAAVASELCAKIKRKFENIYYYKVQIDEECRQLKQSLGKQKGLYVDISWEKKVNKNTQLVDITFFVTLQNKREFIFFGNNFFSDEKLLDVLSLFGRSAWLLPPSILSEELVKLYHQKGFWDVVIDTQEDNDRCFFMLKEHGRAVINDIYIDGAESKTENELIKSYFSEVTSSKYYDEKVLKSAYEKLLRSYIEKGFWQATLLEEKFVRDGPHYNLHLLINEGFRSNIVAIKIPHYQDLEKKGPFLEVDNEGKEKRIVSLEPKIITEQKKWLTEYFHQQGYLYAEISHELIRDENEVTLVWHINQGQKVYFDKTVLIGASSVPFSYLQQELTYKKGDLWSQEKLKQSSLNLKKLGIFDSVYLYPSNVMQKDGKKSLTLRLQKEDPFEIKLRLGFGIQQIDRHFSTAGLTYKCGGYFIMKNMCNLADQFKVETNFSRSRRSIDAAFQLPCIGNFPVKTVFKGYGAEFLYPGCIGISKNIYQLKQKGILVGMKSVGSYLDVSCNLGIELMRTALSNKKPETIEMMSEIARAINLNDQLFDKYIPYIICEPALVSNLLDNVVNPTKGIFSVLIVKGMFPFGPYRKNAMFIRANWEESFFMPFKYFTFGIHTRVAHIFLQDFQYIMPSERLYLGGANSIRSYVTDRCPPLGVIKDKDNKEHIVPQGGKSLLSMNIEVRFSIYKELGGVLFQDFGFLNNTVFSDIASNHMLTATGFGLYYNTPIGPLRFDFAFKWKNDVPTNRPYAWYLNFGHPF